MFKKIAIATIASLALTTAAWAWTVGTANGNDWDFLYGQGSFSSGHPNTDPVDGIVFTFSSDEVDYLTTPISNNINYNATVKITLGTEVVSGTPVYTANNDGQSCSAPAAVRVLLRKGTGLSDPDKRWWSNPIKLNLSPGTETELTIPVDKNNWSNVDGQFSESKLKAFLNSTPDSVGVTFGACFFGHGVKVSSGGTAKFHIRDMRVNNP